MYKIVDEKNRVISLGDSIPRLMNMFVGVCLRPDINKFPFKEIHIIPISYDEYIELRKNLDDEIEDFRIRN